MFGSGQGSMLRWHANACSALRAGGQWPSTLASWCSSSARPMAACLAAQLVRAVLAGAPCRDRDSQTRNRSEVRAGSLACFSVTGCAYGPAALLRGSLLRMEMAEKGAAIG